MMQPILSFMMFPSGETSFDHGYERGGFAEAGFWKKKKLFMQMRCVHEDVIKTSFMIRACM